jgi:hypothetical protein
VIEILEEKKREFSRNEMLIEHMDWALEKQVGSR